MKSSGRVLIIAGSDSGGGAGIQADIKTVTMLGGYAATAITAITVQNTLGVTGVLEIDAALVEAQGRAVLDDIGADAIKTGMLADRAIVAAAARLIDHAKVPAVIDPVMVAKGGAALLADGAVAGLFRFGCDVDLFYSDIEQIMSMSRAAAERALVQAAAEAARAAAGGAI